MYAMAGRWIPPSERSRFMSSFQGFSFGIGLTYPLCGWLIANFGWRVVFYVTGSFGFTWCIFWFLLAYDTPAVHPRITPYERSYIEVSLGETVVKGKGLPVPWKELFKSLPVWAIGITTFGRIWVSYTFIISGPLYMKTVLGFSIQTNGLLNGAPFLLSYVTSVIFCYLADVIVTKNVMSLKNVRKMNTAIAQVVPGLICVLIGYLGCNIVPILVVWFIAVSCITAAYAGAMASIVDIAPNLAGPILAFAQTIHMSASFLSPIVAGFLLKENQSLEQWRIVFAVTAIVSVSTYFMFQIYGTDEVQAWNYPDSKPPMQQDDTNTPLQLLNVDEGQKSSSSEPKEK
ncbi:Hypothetical predicted protein [Cloeon dipterum]|uniref:Major facilitator superfamily (MFS) profile domain-containing protein n=1 Tax=Cloeon dipterum TaxID=197152 RepID=A0A8S1CJG7_9INSE|nr:Hypothetical predicted protein [Cloeon dipterum]